MLSSRIKSDQLRRWLAALGAGAFVWSLLSIAGGWLSVRKVEATSSIDEQHGPQRAAEANTLETPNGEPSWLLPDGTPGAIRFLFGGRRRVDEVLLLNARNRLLFDRGTHNYRLALLDAAGEHIVDEGVLPAYPAWKTVPLAGRVASGAIVYVDSFTGKGGGLSEVAFRGERYGLMRFLPLELTLLAAALVATFYTRLAARLQTKERRKQLTMVMLMLLLVAVGLRTLHFFTAVSAFEWGGYFDVHEITTLDQALAFFAQLRIPIPAWLAALEIVVQHFTGDIELVTRFLYRFSIIAAHCIAVALAYPSLKRMVCTTLVASLCVAGTGVVHQANPQIYDTVFAFLTIAILGLIAYATRASEKHRVVLLGLAGFAASLWGLTRPFALLLLPLIVGFVLLRFPTQRRRGFLVFLLPIVLFCGGWHAQLYVRHGQLGMSNHSGFNLQRAWWMVPAPKLLNESSMPPFRGMNNPEHGKNSKLMAGAVLSWMVEHPNEAFDHFVGRTVAVLDARTDFPGRHSPISRLALPYQLTMRLLMALAFLSLFARATELLGRARKTFSLDGLASMRVSDLSLALLGGTILMVTIGEVGEESRFVISFVPHLVSMIGSASVIPRRYPLEREA